MTPPIRTCMGSGVKQEKSALMRLVKSQDDNLMIDAEGKRVRGAYLSKHGNQIVKNYCQLAIKNKKLEKAFQARKVNPDFPQEPSSASSDIDGPR